MSRCIKVYAPALARRSSRRSSRLCSRRPSILVPPCADRFKRSRHDRIRTSSTHSSRCLCRGRAELEEERCSPPPFRRTRRMSSGRARPARSSNPSVPRASRHSSSTRTPSPPAWSPSRNREPIVSRRRDTRGVRPSGRCRNRAIGSKTESSLADTNGFGSFASDAVQWRAFRRLTSKHAAPPFAPRPGLESFALTSSYALQLHPSRGCVFAYRNLGVHRRPELRRGTATRCCSSAAR